jgi:hypothetical protein
MLNINFGPNVIAIPLYNIYHKQLHSFGSFLGGFNDQ